jgi:hypothetical protein
MFDCSEFYTLSQGGYGNNGGSCLGSDGVNTIMTLLGSTDLVIGTTNSITVPATIAGATKLNQTLPGGSGATALPAGNCIITTGCFAISNLPDIRWKDQQRTIVSNNYISIECKME